MRRSAAVRGGLWSSTWVVVTVATLGFWIITAVALLIYTADAREPTVREWVIPDGAFGAIAAGDNPLALPAAWDYFDGDVLVVRNQDSVVHTVGRWSIAPDSVFEIELRPVAAGTLVCSLHPSGTIRLDVQPRGFDVGQTMFPALAFGPVLGLIVVGARRLMTALGDETDGEAVTGSPS